jgi:hypothetical protein
MSIPAIETPKHKTEYVGYVVFLGADAPYGRLGAGSTAYIHSRANAMNTINTSRDVSCWGKIRILKLYSPCPCCGTLLEAIIPEAWIAKGKVCFVDKGTPLQARPITRERRPHDWSDVRMLDE